LGCFFEGVGDHRGGAAEADFIHGLAKFSTVLGLVNNLVVGPDHFDSEFFEDLLLVEVGGYVEGGLPAQGCQKSVGPLLLDDFGDELRGDGLDVGDIGQLRIRHDGRRIGVDENDSEPLRFQGSHGLRAGIVELTGLADDNRARPDDEDAFQVVSFGHGGLP